MKKNETQSAKKVISSMLKIAIKEKPLLFFSYFLAFVVDLLRKVQVIIVPKFLIDELVLIYNGSDVVNHVKKAAFYTVITLILQFTAGIIEHISNRIKSNINEWFNLYFEVKTNEHVMKIDFEHTEDPEVLDKVHKAKEGISWYSGNVCGILDQLFKIIDNTVILCGVITVISISTPLIIPIEIVSLFLIAIFNNKINKIEIESFKRIAKSNRVFGYIFWELSDFTFGKDIRMYESYDLFDKRANEQLDKQVKVWNFQAEGTKKQQYIINIIDAVSTGIIYFYIGLKAIKRLVSIGDFSMLVSANSTLNTSCQNIVRAFQEIQKRVTYAKQYFDFMEFSDAMEKGNQAIDQKAEHIIEFKNVSFKYPRTDNLILENVNITITSGQHLAVVGLNGAGKTTFIKLLCRLYDVTSGEILIDGKNIKNYSDDEYKKLFAVVFQDFKLFAFTLKENISFSLEADDEGVKKVLQESGLYDDVQKMPKEMLTCLQKSFDKDGLELSGGQKQKTALSRALYKNAPIVILDEPTAALDPIAEADIYSRFNTTLAGGKTAIYISHRLSSCKFCDKIAVFSDRTIKEYGNHKELIKLENGIYRQMFEAQAKQYRSFN